MGNSMAKQQAAGQARMLERQMELQMQMRERMMAVRASPVVRQSFPGLCATC
jgi:hypothetical protein